MSSREEERNNRVWSVTDIPYLGLGKNTRPARVGDEVGMMVWVRLIHGCTAILAQIHVMSRTHVN
jgi:hypothetical protein